MIKAHTKQVREEMFNLVLLHNHLIKRNIQHQSSSLPKKGSLGMSLEDSAQIKRPKKTIAYRYLTSPKIRP
jgi:hypothetical protein